MRITTSAIWGIILGIIKLNISMLELLEKILKKVSPPGIFYIVHHNENGSKDNTNAAHYGSNTPSKPLKRIKLFVDIDISPGGSSKVVSVATKDVMDLNPPSTFGKIISKIVSPIMVVTVGAKDWLKQFVGLGVASPILLHRKTRSPKRRVSQPGKLFGLLKKTSVSSSENVMVLPENGYSENQEGHTAHNTSRNQNVEKRKRSEGGVSESDEDLTFADVDQCEDEEQKLSEVSPKELDKDDNKEIALDSDNNSDQRSSSQEEYGSPKGIPTHEILNEAVNGYESDKDPDYQPPLDESSSSDSDISDSEDVTTTVDEVLELKRDTAEFEQFQSAVNSPETVDPMTADELKKRPVHNVNMNNDESSSSQTSEVTFVPSMNLNLQFNENQKESEDPFPVKPFMHNKKGN